MHRAAFKGCLSTVNGAGRLVSVLPMSAGRATIQYWEPLPGVPGVAQLVLEEDIPSLSEASYMLKRMGMKK